MASTKTTQAVSGPKLKKLSSMLMHHISMVPGKSTQVVCPTCKTWRAIDRRKLVTHKDEGVDCPDSRMRLDMDLSFEQWQEQLREGIVSAAGVTAHRTHTKPRIARAAAPGQAGRAHQMEAQLAEHAAACEICNTVTGRRCGKLRSVELRLALQSHTAGCGTCQIGRRCGKGTRLNNEVAADSHFCLDCRAGNPCQRYTVLRHLVSRDKHSGRCARCRNGVPCGEALMFQAQVDLDAHTADCVTCGHRPADQQRAHRVRLVARRERGRFLMQQQLAEDLTPRRYRVAA